MISLSLYLLSCMTAIQSLQPVDPEEIHDLSPRLYLFVQLGVDNSYYQQVTVNLPSTLGDNHFGSVRREAVPQIKVLQLGLDPRQRVRGRELVVMVVHVPGRRHGQHRRIGIYGD